MHNLKYASTNLMEEGKLREATAISAKLAGARGELEPTFYIYSPRDAISRLDSRLPVALRTADWAQVLQLLKSPLAVPDRCELRHRRSAHIDPHASCRGGSNPHDATEVRWLP